MVRESVEYAFKNPAASVDYIRKYANDMSEEVQKRHIDLYVNKFSIDLGEQGRKAVELLFRKESWDSFPKSQSHYLFEMIGTV